jgi:hypothetical protein
MQGHQYTMSPAAKLTAIKRIRDKLEFQRAILLRHIPTPTPDPRLQGQGFLKNLHHVVTAGVSVTLYTRIWEVLGSNLGPDIGYPD